MEFFLYLARPCIKKYWLQDFSGSKWKDILSAKDEEKREITILCPSLFYGIKEMQRLWFPFFFFFLFRNLEMKLLAIIIVGQLVIIAYNLFCWSTLCSQVLSDLRHHLTTNLNSFFVDVFCFWFPTVVLHVEHADVFENCCYSQHQKQMSHAAPSTFRF